MTLPTAADFENAKQDLDDLAQIVNSVESEEITTRLGNTIPSLTKFFSDLETQITAAQTSLLETITEQAEVIESQHSEILQAAETATTAATEAAQLVETLASDSALSETLLQPVIANMGVLILKNAAQTHNIKIPGVNA